MSATMLYAGVEIACILYFIGCEQGALGWPN